MIDCAEAKCFMLQNKAFGLPKICKIRHWEAEIIDLIFSLMSAK